MLSTRLHYVPETDTTAIERIQDCTPIVEHAKALHNEGIHGSSEMRHAARFPMVIVERYCNEKGIGFDEFMQAEEHLRAMLADPALAAFRVWGGKV
jgi:hypothetical protein